MPKARRVKPTTGIKLPKFKTRQRKSKAKAGGKKIK